jgi:hypothetical protein
MKGTTRFGGYSSISLANLYARRRSALGPKTATQMPADFLLRGSDVRCQRFTRVYITTYLKKKVLLQTNAIISKTWVVLKGENDAESVHKRRFSRTKP